MAGQGGTLLSGWLFVGGTSVAHPGAEHGESLLRLDSDTGRQLPCGEASSSSDLGPASGLPSQHLSGPEKTEKVLTSGFRPSKS